MITTMFKTIHFNKLTSKLAQSVIKNSVRLQSKKVAIVLCAQAARSLCSGPTKEYPLVEYNEIKLLPKTPEKRLIDVRESVELAETGTILTSCNIPLGELYEALQLSSEAFKSKYHCTMPAKDQYIIFTCRAGVRAVSAAEIADQLKYQRIHVYKGSWIDWAKHENLPY